MPLQGERNLILTLSPEQCLMQMETEMRRWHLTMRTVDFSLISTSPNKNPNRCLRWHTRKKIIIKKTAKLIFRTQHVEQILIISGHEVTAQNLN